MDKQARFPEATPKPTKATKTTKKKTSLGNLKKPEPEGNPDDLDSVVNSEPRKKITHSNTIDAESVEKMKTEMISELSFVQPETACACGYFHTITLSNDGTVHSFGRNGKGALGLGHRNHVYLPTPIPNLPKINMISCGFNFTVCVDDEGFIWSFGENDSGQLGTGNTTTSFDVPQKLQDIPPVLIVSCGGYFSLMITNEDNLWSWGSNDKGQLCLGDRKICYQVH